MSAHELKFFFQNGLLICKAQFENPESPILSTSVMEVLIFESSKLRILHQNELDKNNRRTQDILIDFQNSVTDTILRPPYLAGNTACAVLTTFGFSFHRKL